MIPENWKIEKGRLVREFEFDDFKSALDFVNKVGEIAEEKEHHPDIYLSYGKVRIELVTHEEDEVTEKDEEIAKEINKL
ncbi:MAG: 4a-hydroxytetrahydrobiopterin dehydratase [bacterium]